MRRLAQNLEDNQSALDGGRAHRLIEQNRAERGEERRVAGCIGDVELRCRVFKDGMNYLQLAIRAPDCAAWVINSLIYNA